MPQLTPTVEEHLLTWLPKQRWFGANEPTELTRVGGLVLPDPSEAAQFISYLYRVEYRDEAPETGNIIHVPVVVKDEADPALAEYLIGESQRTSRRNPAKKFFYDGTADPAFIRAWLQFIHNADEAYAERVLGQPTAGYGLWPEIPQKLDIEVLPGEQSNTSVKILGDQEPLLLKFFRRLRPGQNQDVTHGIALDAARSTVVATTYGTITASWAPDATEHQEPVPVHIRKPVALDYGFDRTQPAQETELFDLVEHFAGEDLQLVTGQLCVLRQYFPDAVDAWQLASLAAVRGHSFTVEAEEIGATLARLHKDLAVALGAQAADSDDRSTYINDLIGRLRWGYANAKEIIGDHDAAFNALIDELEAFGDDGELSPLQTIHSDLHLGQVIRSDGHDWKVIDFEGEPLRQSNGSTKDVIERDLAGMLRSFDYAAALAHRVYFADQGSEQPALTQAGAAQWAKTCGAEFLKGYGNAAGKDFEGFEDSLIGHALLLDKALYEVAYELTHRQDWVHVPALAAQRLLTADALTLQEENT